MEKAILFLDKVMNERKISYIQLLNELNLRLITEIEFCAKLYILVEKIIYDDAADGLEGCLTCLRIDVPTDVVYYIPQRGEMTYTHYPLLPYQFVYAVALALYFEKCDINDVEEGEIEIIVGSHVIFIRRNEVMYENYSDVMDVKKDTYPLGSLMGLVNLIKQSIG
jgi:hypothetical protein